MAMDNSTAPTEKLNVVVTIGPARRREVVAARAPNHLQGLFGSTPGNLVEKIVRLKVYSMTYWKEHCFGLNAETLVDKAMDLDHVGGTYGGNQKATDFLCLVLKMCQIQPEKEIVVEFIKNEDYKYVRALGAFYMRLVGTSLDVYQYLEPLYNDYRKLRVRNGEGTFQLSHVDEFVDEMLTKDFLCNIALPRIPTRWTLEASTRLEPRISALEDFEEELEEDAAEQAAAEAAALEQQAQEATLELERARERARGGGGPLSGPPARGGSHADNGSEHHRADRHHRERDHERHAERSPKDSERWRGERERERDDRRDGHGHEDNGRSSHRRHEDNGRSSHRRHEDRERRRDDDRDGGRDGRDDRRRSPDRRERREEAKKRRSRSSSPARQDRKEKKREKRHKEEEKLSTGGGTGDVEIDEANALRAKLGLKPLR